MNPDSRRTNKLEDVGARAQDFEESAFGDFDFEIWFPRYASIFDLSRICSTLEGDSTKSHF